MPIIIQDPAHLRTVQEFADRTNQRHQLNEKLNYLEEMCNRKEWTLFIHPDFVPMSFYFQIFPTATIKDDRIPDDWKYCRIMNGGVIYHGKLEDNTTPETFSVELTPTSSWSIHT